MRTYTDPDTLTTTARRTGVMRRLRALAWMGHDPARVLDEYADLDPATRARLLRLVESGSKFWKNHHGFRVDVWCDVATAYDDLSMTFGPDTAARENAQARSWTPPLGWDDDELDDTDARSRTWTTRRHIDGHTDGRGEHDHAVVARRIAGDHTVTLRVPDTLEAVRILHSRGLSDHSIADALGVWNAQVHRARRELGLEAHPDNTGGASWRNHVKGLQNRAKDRARRAA